VGTPQKAYHAFLGAIYKEGTAKDASTARSRTFGLGLSLKPDISGRDFFILGHHDRPGKFSIFREDFRFKPYLQGFRYTNDREKLAEGRIVASNALSRAIPEQRASTPEHFATTFRNSVDAYQIQALRKSQTFTPWVRKT
jgi:hypothetical protein